MGKLVTDKPENNIQLMYNLVFIKNKRVWLRKVDDGKDIDLVDYIKKRCSFKGCNIISEDDLELFEEQMADCTCPISLLYWVCVGFAGAREHLREYEMKEDNKKPVWYLDERICDCEDCENTQTYREYITTTENEFGIKHELIDKYTDEELKSI